MEPVLELALVVQADLELKDPPAFASRMLGLKADITTAQVDLLFSGSFLDDLIAE